MLSAQATTSVRIGEACTDQWSAPRLLVDTDHADNELFCVVTRSATVDTSVLTLASFTLPTNQSINQSLLVLINN